MHNDRKWIGMTPDSFSNKTCYNKRSLKNNGGQKQDTGFKETHRGI